MTPSLYSRRRAPAGLVDPTCAAWKTVPGARSPTARSSQPVRSEVPGAAGYLRRPGQTAFLPFVLTVLRIEDGCLTDIAAFEQPSMFTAFGLPASL